MLPSVIGGPGGCLGAIASPPASQALIPAREPSPRALSVGRFREPGPACGCSGRWHAIAARGEIAIRATAAPVRDRQRFGGGDGRAGDQQHQSDSGHSGSPCRFKPSSHVAERHRRAGRVLGVHSITSSAMASTLEEWSSPSAFAVLRLIVSSYLVGACTGRSAGFSPLRMRST